MYDPHYLIVEDVTQVNRGVCQRFWLTEDYWLSGAVVTSVLSMTKWKK
jgi:hypothetical protein